jgi:hypothetical protein
MSQCSVYPISSDWLADSSYFWVRMLVSKFLFLSALDIREISSDWLCIAGRAASCGVFVLLDDRKVRFSSADDSSSDH